MSKRTRAFIIVLVLLTVGVLGFALFGRGAAVDTPPIILPTESPRAAETPKPTQSPATEVTPETVQAAIKTLVRPDSYSRTVTLEDFWEGGSAVTELEVHISGGSARIIDSASGRNVLITGGTLHIWHEGEPGLFEAPAKENEADLWTRTGTYEELLKLPASEILDAGYDSYEGEHCVWAEYISPTLGYRCVSYISVATGLLAGEVCYDGETVVHRMYASKPELTAPNASLFLPPEAEGADSE